MTVQLRVSIPKANRQQRQIELKNKVQYTHNRCTRSYICEYFETFIYFNKNHSAATEKEIRETNYIIQLDVAAAAKERGRRVNQKELMGMKNNGETEIIDYAFAWWQMNSGESR